MMHVAGIPSMMHVAGSRGVFEIEFEWYCTAFLGAMYVGISMILSAGQIYYCEGSPSTFPFSVYFGVGYTGISPDFSLNLRPIFSLNWSKFDSYRDICPCAMKLLKSR